MTVVWTLFEVRQVTDAVHDFQSDAVIASQHGRRSEEVHDLIGKLGSWLAHRKLSPDPNAPELVLVNRRDGNERARSCICVVRPDDAELQRFLGRQGAPPRWAVRILTGHPRGAELVDDIHRFVQETGIRAGGMDRFGRACFDVVRADPLDAEQYLTAFVDGATCNLPAMPKPARRRLATLLRGYFPPL